MATPPPGKGVERLKCAYLTSMYPAISHTFIQREVAALRLRGLDIETFSVRRPKPGDLLTETDRAEHDSTWYILPVPIGQLFGAHIWALARRPGAYLRTLRRAVSLRRQGGKGLLRWCAYFAEAVVLARELKRRGVDHLHNHFANASANVAMLAAEMLGLAWSFTLHGGGTFEVQDLASLGTKVRSARFVVCICDFNRNLAMRVSNFSEWHKLSLARCGVNPEGFRAPQRQPRNGRPLRILSVARLSSEKGLPGLLSAFHRARQAGLSAELRIVGEGPERELIEGEIRRLGLVDDCRLLGALAGDDVKAEYCRADLFAMASLWEGLPVVLMEAMSAGLPVIAPQLAGIPELVEHEKTGLLYAPARWDQLGDAMVRLGTDEHLYQRLAEAGRERAGRQHDIRNAIEPLVELFGCAAAALRPKKSGDATECCAK